MTNRNIARTPRLIGFAFAAAVSTLALSGCEPSSAEKAAPEKRHVAYLWAVGAEDASLVTSDDATYLELRGVEPAIARFTDRPDRQASEVDVRDFLGRWDGRFAKVPPNAVLSYQESADAAPVQVVVEVSRPRYDEATSTIVFAAEVIEYTPDELEGADHPVKAPKVAVPAHTGPVSVFIDSVGPAVTMGPVSAMGEDFAALAALFAQAREALRESPTRTKVQMQAEVELQNIQASSNHLAEMSMAQSQIVAGMGGLSTATVRPSTVVPAEALDLVSSNTRALLEERGSPVPKKVEVRYLTSVADQLQDDLVALLSSQEQNILRLQRMIDEDYFESMSKIQAESLDAIVNRMDAIANRM